ncbi:RagB/SusD family nutrient uptake outer membrane protein [Lewinella sp. JB7]|uniref:RagB/SusD family nutrient uptake outer membrane protein n=1 Tax=Lewinella sp. JB7 TaxID=2962887 RepID=UPI0020C9B226|nr:RagB/SusD family nutrient uptake outer membrane protein [Lewinella sp. JB7]MCP9236977.1 RagB/SusD family nutrient uptake outer membrane protein [Lewinella sp. JB7]
MKFRNLLPLFCGLLLLPSCNEEDLNLNPLSEIGDNGFYTNIGEVQGAVVAIYDGFQQVPLREFALTEMRSDNTKTKSSEGDWAQFESFDVEPTNTAIGQYWAANYNVIFRANRVLENLDVVEDTNLRNQFEGEALFGRALAHFNLVRAYGGVPIVDRVIIQADEEYFAQDSREDVLAFVRNDFERAAGLLPAKSAMPYGRATRGAANALLAKVLLNQGEYAGAANVLKAVIDSDQYRLLDNYGDVFYSEGNDEVLFSINYLDDDSNESQDFSFEFTAGGRVSGLNFPTDDFRAAVDTADTERAAILFNPDAPAEVGKFITQSADARLDGNDWIVIRYADVLLLYAEAIMAGSESTQSLEAIRAYNQVRARAGLSTLEVDGSATLTEEELLHERRIELAFENHRFYDLVRFGEAERILGAFAAANGYTFTPTDLILPIPQGEVNVSQGLLSQNPGY